MGTPACKGLNALHSLSPKTILSLNQENWMGGTRIRNAYKILVGKPLRDYLEYLGVDERKMLK
jgi:hypothetical protein